MRLELDHVTIDSGQKVAYIKLLKNDGSLIMTKDVAFTDQNDLKSKIQNKLLPMKQGEDEAKQAISEINTALSGGI